MRLPVALMLMVCVSAGVAQSNRAKSDVGAWVGTWAASPFDGDPWHQIPTLVDSTLREIVHTSIGGNAVRVHLTNEFGKEPLRVDAVTIAVSAGMRGCQMLLAPADLARASGATLAAVATF